MPPRKQHTPVPVIPQSLIRRFGAKTLHPASAFKAKNTPEVHPTAYVEDVLLVPGSPDGKAADTIELIAEVGKAMGFGIRVEDSFDQVVQTDVPFSSQAQRALSATWVTRVRLVADDPQHPIDAWWVLQTMRQAKLPQQASLDHLVFAAGQVSGHPHIGCREDLAESVSAADRHPGPTPVNMLSPNPRVRAGHVQHRSHVVLIDSALGQHPWFDQDPTVTDHLPVNGHHLGHGGPVDIPREDLLNLSGNLPPLHGHGTFLAGIVRQTCPQARISVVPFMDDEGVALESALIQTLALILAHQIEAVVHNQPTDLIDVVNISAGYYHEQPSVPDYSVALRTVLTHCGQWGINVVAAAGNHASTAPWWPAALATTAPAEHPTVPVVSVGALDTDHTSAAWFSNSGPWVQCYRPGVNVLSTIDQNAADAGTAPVGWPQTTGFPTGFALWSGTSFAAPIFAGELASYLADHRVSDPVTQLDLQRRALAAQNHCLAATG